MLMSPKWEKECSDLQPLDEIVNIPIPFQDTTKILYGLQSSCNSPTKSNQLKALQYWEAWIVSQSLDNWENDSICHFAIKPLLTKKLHPLHKDKDICQLKLNIMWNLLASMQMKMTWDGPKYLLENFLDSCFVWLASAGETENDISVLIVKLLLALFQKKKEVIKNNKYTFPSIQIDEVTLEKHFHIVIDKFLDIFYNWKKFKNTHLIITLWRWFLDYCECLHNSVATTVWHQIFKINQTFCSEKSEPVSQKLTFLHACASKVQKLLTSLKDINSENCFMTPCEALLRKLAEICSTEDLGQISPGDEIELFEMSLDTCQTLACKSIEICDFDLCIQFLDSLEDFHLKSFFWGTWSGLVTCFKKFLLPINRNQYTKKQMKFYRKLRASTVNFELDKMYLSESCVTTVLNNIEILNVNCRCGKNISNSLNGKDVPVFNEKNASAQAESMDTSSSESTSDMDLDVSEYREIVPLKTNSNLVFDFNSDGRTIRVVFDVGKFGRFDGFRRFDERIKSLKINNMNLNLNGVKSIFGGINKARFLANGYFNFHFDFIRLGMDGRSVCSNRYLCSSSSSCENERPKSQKVEIRSNAETAMDVTPKRSGKKRDVSSVDPTIEGECLTPRTRSRRKLEMDLKAKTENVEEKEPTPKKQKNRSFEEVVQEILRKNKIRKTRKSVGDIENVEPVAQPESPPKRQLRSRRKTMSPITEVKSQKTKELKTEKKVVEEEIKTENSKKSEKEDEKSAKIPTHRKLDNFFKVINSPVNESKEGKNASLAKCDTPKRRSKRNSKGPGNWKQTSLKTMIKENEEKFSKEFEKLQDDNEGDKPEKLAVSQMNKPSPLKEIHHDHEYAKIVDSSQVFSDKHNIVEGSQRKTKKSKEKFPDEGDIENLDPEELEKPETLIEKPVPMEVDLVSECEYVKASSPKKKPEEKQLAAESATGSQEDGVIVLEEETDVKNAEIILLPDKEATEEKESDATEDVVMISEEKTETEASDLAGEPTSISKKRLLPSLESSETETKKLKLDDDGVAFLPPENSHVTSPVKSNGKPEENSPTGKGKINSSSPRVVNRVVPTRISRMIALISDKDTGETQPMRETPTQPHSLNASLFRNRKPMKSQGNSRVAKMMANLNRLMSYSPKECVESDEKSTCEASDATTPNGKSISPLSSKKRKFIGFDESKNQTVMYCIDTPPSQVLQEWELMKEEILK